METSGKKVDYLDEDPPIHGQEWICVSFLSPEGVKNCKIRGFKFRGAFGTRQEAEAHAKEIQTKLDPDFHIYVGEGFKWLPWNQDPETVDNQEYHEEELNNLMKTTKEQLLLKKQHEIDRKKQHIQEAMEENNNIKKDPVRERLRAKHMKKVAERTEKDKCVESSAAPSASTEQPTEAAMKVEEEKRKVDELNDGLKKLKDVYERLLEKQAKQSGK